MLEKSIIIAIVGTIIILVAITVYACCKVAAEADRQMETEYYKYCDDDCLYCNISRQCVRSAMRRQEGDKHGRKIKK